MRIMEALEGKGFRLPLTKAEAELAEKLAAIIRQVCLSCPLSDLYTIHYHLTCIRG
jgi:hypothetical protein